MKSRDVFSYTLSGKLKQRSKARFVVEGYMTSEFTGIPIGIHMVKNALKKVAFELIRLIVVEFADEGGEKGVFNHIHASI
jgi:hypothetical protein